MRKKLTFALLIGFTNVLNAQVPELNLDIKQITVSGLSSGGYMATQFHMAHSDWVKGAAILSAGPYFCGQNDIKIALSQCVNKVDGDIPLADLNDTVAKWSESGKIADTKHLQSSKVWLFHGTKDLKVTEPVTDALYQQYRSFVPESNIQYINDKPFAHHFPTLDSGASCDVSKSPFLGKCDYDAAGELLAFLNGKLNPRVSQTSGRLITINQQQLGGKHAGSLADAGYLYVPENCEKGQRCELHISFHGCNQNAGAIDTQYARLSGLNNWADSNNLLVLYPQTKTSLFMPLNPQGCWDWWGYTGDQYATKKAPQIQAIKRIIHTLAQKS